MDKNATPPAQGAPESAHTSSSSSPSTLIAQRDEADEWRRTQQRALIRMAVILLDSGYQGVGVVDGVEWLAIKRLRAEEARDDAEADVSRLASQLQEVQAHADKTVLAWASAADERDANRSEITRLASQLAGLREALTTMASRWALDDPPDGERLAVDACVNELLAALSAVQGSPRTTTDEEGATRIGQPDEGPAPQHAATDGER